MTFAAPGQSTCRQSLNVDLTEVSLINDKMDRPRSVWFAPKKDSILGICELIGSSFFSEKGEVGEEERRQDAQAFYKFIPEKDESNTRFCSFGEGLEDKW